MIELRKNKNTVCYPELVEVFLSEERGKSAKRPSGLRDLVPNLGVLWFDVTFRTASHGESLRDPFVAYAPRFCLFAKAQPAELRLRKTQAFFFAQDDIQRECLVELVRFNALFFHLSACISPRKML